MKKILIIASSENIEEIRNNEDNKKLTFSHELLKGELSPTGKGEPTHYYCSMLGNEGFFENLKKYQKYSEMFFDVDKNQIFKSKGLKKI